ncbi:MAG: hypothetical protein RSD22_09330 [Romboutsia sp.]
MQRIGINKSKNNSRKYFETITENKMINIEDINEINSIIIKPSIIEINQIKNSNKIRIFIRINIKIIYLKENETALYVYNNKYINCKVMNLPKILEGHLINNQSTLNKLKKEVYVENINTKILNKGLLLGYFLSIDISISPTYSIGYIINNSFGDNVFLSHINGQVLTQKTFNQNTYCKNITWNNDGSYLWFIYSSNNNSDIFNVNIENKNVNKITNINVLKNISDFSLVNKNEILIEYYDENEVDVYKLNIRKNEMKKIVKDINTTTKSPYYNSRNKLIYFLMKEDEDYYLYSIDERNNRDIIFNYVNILEYYVSYYLNSIIVKVFKDNELSLFEINIESKFVSPISIGYKYKNILDIKYLYDDENRKQILILLENIDNKQNIYRNSLILCDLNEYTTKKIIEDNIIKFDIDYDTLDIFIVSKKNNLSYVQKINVKDFNKNNSLNLILKLPGTINDISIKKVNYEE